MVVTLASVSVASSWRDSEGDREELGEMAGGRFLARSLEEGKKEEPCRGRRVRKRKKCATGLEESR